MVSFKACRLRIVKAHLALSERWLIAVNGKTEAIYINALRQLFRSSAVEVRHFDKDPLKQVLAAEKLARHEKFRRA